METIKISELTKKYDKLIAVNNIDLNIEEGDFFGFIGPNGAGKTTTIKSMLNLLKINSGTIEIFGQNIKLNQFQDHIGYVPGEANLYDNLSVKEQINYFAKYYKNIDWPYIENLKKIFKINVNDRISNLSLGNKKKISIICSLMNKPKLLIFDEVSNSLDPLMQKVLFDELLTLNKSGVTIFFSSHNLEEVQNYCKNVAIIKEGKIIAVDNIEKVTQQMGVEVIIKTKTKIDESFFKKEKIAVHTIDDNTIRFLYKEDINKLIKLVTKYDIVSLRITDVKLEEIFSEYYKNEEVK